MDPQRFDSIAKRLGTRVSRRGALRASAGAALGVVAASRFLPTLAQNPETTVKDRFISVRSYPYTGSITDAQEGLKALVPLMEQQAGFISIDFVGGDKSIYIVASFLDKTTAVAAAKAEDEWIANNAAEILAGKPDIRSGTVFLRSELQTGCGCTIGVENACNSERLVCCGTTGVPGGEGICLTTATTCPGEEPVAPTATAVPPTEVPACTGEGCACNGGVQITCDEGLVCCGADMPGGAGTCLTEAECYPPCTGEGCACNGGVQFSCDDGLICCGADTPGGAGTCLTEAECYPPCTGEGCACSGGVQFACDDGLTCCGADSPGGQGVCAYDCGGGACTGEGCACSGGVQGACDEGLECCGADTPGGQGVCQAACG